MHRFSTKSYISLKIRIFQTQHAIEMQFLASKTEYNFFEIFNPWQIPLNITNKQLLSYYATFNKESSLTNRLRFTLVYTFYCLWDGTLSTKETDGVFLFLVTVWTKGHAYQVRHTFKD